MHQFGVFYNVNTMTGPKEHMLTMGSRFFFFLQIDSIQRGMGKDGRERKRVGERERGKMKKYKDLG